MSLGTIASTLGGAAQGFSMGGLWGAVAGAVFGFGLGMVAEATQPGIAGPEVTQLVAPSATEGIPIADILGTTQICGNFIWYCCPRSKKIKKKAGKKKVTVGHKYYLSFAISLYRGSVDVIYCIYEGDALLWEGPLFLADATNGCVIISIEDRGEIYFYFGTDDQVHDAFMSEKTGYELDYKGLCYAVFHDFMIGTQNRVGNFEFIIKKNPEYTFNPSHLIGTYDYNPVHAIYHCLRSAELLSDKIDEVSFSAAADTLLSEGLGISMNIGLQGALIKYIESICYHIRGCIFLNSSGKIAIRLYRKDVDIVDMVVISDDDILEDITVNQGNMLAAKNEVQAQYTSISND